MLQEVICDYQINLENATNLSSSVLGVGIKLSYPYKFMSDYKYFPNNVKDIKDYI